MKTKNLNGYYNVVGQNIRKYRERKGISQRQLANKLNLKGINLYHSDISRIETNDLFIRDYELIGICKILGITYEQIFEDTEKYFD